MKIKKIPQKGFRWAFFSGVIQEIPFLTVPNLSLPRIVHVSIGNMNVSCKNLKNWSNLPAFSLFDLSINDANKKI